MDILASDSVLEKLWGRELTLDEVKQAVCFYGYDHAKWVTDKSRGRRLAVRGRTDAGVPLFVILGIEKPEDGIWHLRSARREDR